MKIHFKVILILFLTCSFVVAFPGVIPDANTFLLGRILVQGINEVKSLEETYNKIREFTSLSQETKNNISTMLQMEQDVDKALHNAKNISDFKFSDVKYLLEKSSASEPDPSSYLEEGSVTAQLLAKIKKTSSMVPGTGQTINSMTASGSKLYQIFHQPLGLPSFRGSPNKTVNEQIGIENYLAEDHGASYQILIAFAERFQQQALEIESSVKQNDLFSMNSAERIELLLKAGSLIEKAVELKIKANEILQLPPPPTVHAVSKAAEYLGIQSSLSQRAIEGRTVSEQLFDN